MARRRIRYYFGRLNLIAQRPDRDRLLVDTMSAEGITVHRGLSWGFFDINIFSTDLGEFISGFLAKFRSESREEVAIPKTHQIDRQMIENLITAKARFFLHVPSHIIAYHPVAEEISRAIFVSRFKQVLEENAGRFFVEIEILPIDEQHSIRIALRGLKRIFSVHVRLHPSNPANRDVWRKVDERLRKMQVGSYRESYDSPQSDEGLNISEDEDLDRKIAMAEDGYGVVSVAGESEGKRKIISTRDTPVAAKASDDRHDAEVVIEDLSDTIRNILERFEK